MAHRQVSFDRYRQGNRRIHVDFHNPDFVTDIGHHLDAHAYARAQGRYHIGP